VPVPTADVVTVLDPGVPLTEYLGDCKLYENSRYFVVVRELSTPWGPCRHLSVRNQDRSARHDWRELQRVKNELAGPEWEAVELYPAESRLVDQSNQYHLFVFQPSFMFPFGFFERKVARGNRGNTKQRAFEEPPPDLED
jgi:hypothetical protein